jgi:hypothetical protein
MNRDFVPFNLREAEQALSGTIKEIESDAAYGHFELSIEMAHLYHHLNTAWNARESSEERARVCSQEDYEQWSRFPLDLTPLGTV